MAIDRKALASRIRELHDLSADEKSALLELLNTRKKYGLVWEDKPEKVEEELLEKLPVLKEVTKRRILSKELDAPDHILIEGDNLHALTALQYTHAGKIDVIYIDPPYNTGNKDFIYNDSFVDKEDAWRHSKWLSFMSKRLKLAKHLLKETGVIFISIDDNEQAQVKLLCDEIFREDMYAGLIPWRKRTAKADVPFGISQDFEWLICFARSNEFVAGISISRKYYKTDDYESPWRLADLTKQCTKAERPNSFFSIKNPRNGKKYPANPTRVWSITTDTVDEYLSKGKIVFPDDYEFLNISKPAYRVFECEDIQKNKKKHGHESAQSSVSTLLPESVGRTEHGNKDLAEMFEEKLFPFPKPLSLIQYVLKIASKTNSLILDFFAGSGTTLHATIALNSEDGGNRSCILVTNNENGICEHVTYERNKRVIQGYTNSKGESVPGLMKNNMRYYQVGFVERAPSMKNRKELTYCAVDLLCIRENCYEPMEVTTKEILVFGKKSFNHETLGIHGKEDEKFLVVILEPREIEVAVSIIKKLPGHCKVYVFSPGHYAFDDEFEEVVEKIELCALPEAILQAYNKVLPKAKRKFIEELEKGALEE